MRRFPCDCIPCNTQINEPWDTEIPDDDWTTQPRFKNPENCEYKPVLEDYNDWKFVTVEPTKNSTPQEQQEELTLFYNEILQQYEDRAKEEIVVGGFGAMETEADTNGYYLIKWTSEPYQLTEETEVEGCSAGPMPKGTFVCDGKYWDPLHRSHNWFYCNPEAETFVFRLQFIVAPNINMVCYNEAANIKPNYRLPNAIRQTAQETVKFVPVEIQKIIEEEKELRDKLDHNEYAIDNDVDDESENEDEEEEEEDEDEDEDE
jgi:hypothetical protein